MTDAENKKVRQWRQKDTTSTEQKRIEEKGWEGLGTAEGAGCVPLPSSLGLEWESSCHTRPGICKSFCKVPNSKYFRLCRPCGLCLNYSNCRRSSKTAVDDMKLNGCVRLKKKF